MSEGKTEAERVVDWLAENYPAYLPETLEEGPGDAIISAFELAMQELTDALVQLAVQSGWSEDEFRAAMETI